MQSFVRYFPLRHVNFGLIVHVDTHVKFLHAKVVQGVEQYYPHNMIGRVTSTR